MSEYVSLLDKFQAAAALKLEQFRAKMRVKVAKDVLATMDGLTVKKGSFVITEYGLPKDSKKAAKQLQKTKNCQVCALGACFVSLVKFDNKLTRDWQDLVGMSAAPAIQDRLGEYFDEKQIVLIDNAFEQGRGFFSQSNNELRGVDATKAIAFGEKYDSDSKRLAAIMKNIVKNNGTFKP